MSFRRPIPTLTCILSLTLATGVVWRLYRWWSGSRRCLSNRSSSGLEHDPVKWQEPSNIFVRPFSCLSHVVGINSKTITVRSCDFQQRVDFGVLNTTFILQIPGELPVAWSLNETVVDKHGVKRRFSTNKSASLHLGNDTRWVYRPCYKERLIESRIG